MDYVVTTKEKFEKKVKLKKNTIIDDIKDAVEELELIKSGKLKARNVENLLNELK